MKSRWTTYLLLAITAIVWGVIAWKILNPPSDATPSSSGIRRPTTHKATTAQDSLRCNYPDPFLKGEAPPIVKAIVRALPPAAKPIVPERMQAEHLGAVGATGHLCHIVTINGEQYELFSGEQAGEFTLTHTDRDSLYFKKQGIQYGVKRCE